MTKILLAASVSPLVPGTGAHPGEGFPLYLGSPSPLMVPDDQSLKDEKKKKGPADGYENIGMQIGLQCFYILMAANGNFISDHNEENVYKTIILSFK